MSEQRPNAKDSAPASERLQRKLYSLFHKFTFLPGHARSFTPSAPKSVTYVLNLYLLAPGFALPCLDVVR